MMDFWIYFYTSLVFLTSQVLAFNPRDKLLSISRFDHDDTELKILERILKEISYDLRGTKASQEGISELGIDEKPASFYVRKLLDPKPDSTRWRSTIADSSSFNEIPESSSEFLKRGGLKKPATFEELEKQNANIYNPLLNLDHYPIPSKKYTFEELENMNANQYNPYLN